MRDNIQETMTRKLTSMLPGASELLTIVLKQGITLVESGVNPDKVYSWVTRVNWEFNNQPRPTSQKELDKKAKAWARKEEKKKRINDLVSQFNELIVKFDIRAFAFIYEIDESVIKIMKDIVHLKGFHYLDYDCELIISGRPINPKDHKTIQKTKSLIDDITNFYKTENIRTRLFIDDHVKLFSLVNEL